MKEIYGKKAREVFRAIKKGFFSFKKMVLIHAIAIMMIKPSLKTSIKAKLIEDAIYYHNNPDKIYEIFRRNKWIANTLLLITKEKMGIGIKELIITIIIRLIELLSIPLFILSFIFHNYFLIRIIFLLPFMFLIYLSFKQKY